MQIKLRLSTINIGRSSSESFALSGKLLTFFALTQILFSTFSPLNSLGQTIIPVPPNYVSTGTVSFYKVRTPVVDGRATHFLSGGSPPIGLAIRTYDSQGILIQIETTHSVDYGNTPASRRLCLFTEGGCSPSYTWDVQVISPIGSVSLVQNPIPPTDCEGITYYNSSATSALNEYYTWSFSDIVGTTGESAGTIERVGLATNAIRVVWNPRFQGTLKLIAGAGNYVSSGYSTPFFIQRKAKVFGLTLSTPLTNNERCQSRIVEFSQFTAGTFNTGESRNWFITPLEAGSIDATGKVSWNTGFYDNSATVRVTVNGCGGSTETQSVTINVKKLPNNYSLTGPSQLCPNGLGEIVLSGSEALALYELWREEAGQWILVRGQSGASRWGLPISNISPGKYFVRSSLNGCSLDTQPLIISETTLGVMDLKTITPKIAFRRMGVGSTQFTAQYSGAPINSSWSIPVGTGAGTLTQNGNTAIIDWNPTFTGDATIVFNANGCAGPREISQTITVYPQDENFVQVLVAEESINSVNAMIAQANNPDKVDASTNYIDGLGRSNQIVDHFASPIRTKDIVTRKEYDQYGRESTSYLPFTSTNSTGYRYQANTEQINFYSSSAKIANDNSPYAVTIFEPSPINRIVEQGAPGIAWQPGTGSVMKFNYSLNIANEVFKFSYDATSGLISLPTAAGRFYQASELQVNTTIDENKNMVMAYVDKLGRTICKKVQYRKLSTTDPPADPVNQGHWASTYYIYDDLGNLAVVLPPEAVTRFTQP